MVVKRVLSGLRPVKNKSTLLFHIGHHKTGTTTIQNALATGAVSVKGKTLLYPSRLAHNYLPRQFQQYIAGEELPKGDINAPNLKEISELLAQGDYDVVVISAEEFERANPKNVAKVLNEAMLPYVDDHAIICYVRPHAGRFLSNFAEHIKIGIDEGTPEQFFERVINDGRFHFCQNLAKWSSEFKNHFKLRPLVRAELEAGSVLIDFFKTGIGHECDVDLSRVSNANESLSLEELMVLKLVHKQLPVRAGLLRHNVGWNVSIALSGLVRQGGPNTKLALHKTLAERLRAAYREDATDLDNTFFGGKPLMRQDLDRAVDTALPHAQSVEPEDYLSQDAIRATSVLAKQITLMLQYKGGTWRDFFHNQRIADLHGSNAFKM